MTAPRHEAQGSKEPVRDPPVGLATPDAEDIRADATRHISMGWAGSALSVPDPDMSKDANSVTNRRQRLGLRSIMFDPLDSAALVELHRTLGGRGE